MKSLAAETLATGGPVARALGPGHEARPQQIEMARAIELALASRGRLLVEAGTGVGKSFAYLVPAMLRATRHGERVVVATNTIALQEQIVARDVPLLSRTLETWPGAGDAAADLRCVLVKGRSNYLSIRRLKLASQRQAALPDASWRRSLHVIEEWAYGTVDGTRSTLPRLEHEGAWDLAQSDSGNCMGRACPHHQECFYQNARREMERGNLLVTNHALLFADLALRARGASILPECDHVIIDEAHGAEDAAHDHFGCSLAEGRIMHLLGLLYNHRTGKGFLASRSLGAGDASAIDAACHAVLGAQEAARAFFADFSALLRSGTLKGGRIPGPGLVEDELSPAMTDLALRLADLREACRDEPDRYELNSYIERCKAAAGDARALTEQSIPGCVYWAEEAGGAPAPGRRGGQPRIRVACSPVEVGPLLAEHLFGRPWSVVLTSATLSTMVGRRPGPGPAAAAPAPPGRRVVPVEDEPAPPTGEDATAPPGAAAPPATREGLDHARKRLGCAGAPGLVLGSPFDIPRQARVIVDLDAPEQTFGSGGAEAFERALADRIEHHAAATDGGAFVLFTAHRTLSRCAALLRPRLEERGLALLVQGEDGSRTEILQRFRENPRSVLFGAATFWQGVDVRGEALRNVIITRLPFDPPDRPLSAARAERIESLGGDPFREDSLPRAVLRFKQGFGRLIRSREDRGQVVVLDRRLVTKSYGRAFIDALPPGVAVERVGGARPARGSRKS